MNHEEAARAFAETIRRASRGDHTGFQIAIGRCESPIEQAFCLAMFPIPNVRAIDGEFNAAQLPTLAGREPRITVFAQQPILRYRADFLLVGTSPLSAEPAFVIVECDGEAFHSTREQHRRDAARQHELVDTGFHVERFSGSLLFRDPEAVVERTLTAFKPHAWRPTETYRWVSNRRLRDALAELRSLAEMAEGRRQGPSAR